MNAPVPVKPAVVAATEGDFQTVVDRSRELLMRGGLPSAETVKGDVATLDGQGRWPDVDYTDTSPAEWSPARHLRRVREMARALVDPKSPLYHDAAVEGAIGRGLDDWIAHRYQCPNWWHNDIGVPLIMSDIILLMGDRLSGARREGALAVLNQGKKARAGDGANTMWMAGIGLIYGALTHDGAVVGSNSQLISGEIHVTGARASRTTAAITSTGSACSSSTMGARS